jgi:hypothetical protein
MSGPRRSLAVDDNERSVGVATRATTIPTVPAAWQALIPPGSLPVTVTDSNDSPLRSRRAVLGTVPAFLVALAGCSGGGDGSGGTTDSTTDEGSADDGGGATTSEPPTGSPTTTPTGSQGDTTAEGNGELDLREANVTGVEFERSNGSYRFSVTLYHDDDGEDGYANWWQVETTGGDRLGRRELLHSHGTREFTRSATIEVPSGVTTVVVRGHDQTHGYGGQAALVDLESESVEFVRQGPQRTPIGE